jgi:hypothetical protein
MKMSKCRFIGTFVLACGLTLGGCGGNPNRAEYDAHTPPGKPFDDPNDSKVAYRRERTRNVSKQVQKIEAKGREAAEKAETP